MNHRAVALKFFLTKYVFFLKIWIYWVYLFFFISQNNWNHNDVPARETGQGMSSSMIRQAVHLPTDYPDFLNIPKNVGTNPSEHKKNCVCTMQPVCSLSITIVSLDNISVLFLSTL